MASIYNWSTTAADNSNADSSIDWTEGMAPSEVNDSARFMMARVAEYVTDQGGGIVATGTANAILVTTESGFITYEDGLRLSFRTIDDNTSTVTLSVNSIGTRPIVKFTSSGETALAAGDLKEDGVYTVQYAEDLNSANGAWVLLNPTPQPIPTEVPAGAVSPFAMNSAPTGWLKCDGAAVSRATYAALFTAIGTTWGSGNGTTTFNVPDLRGEFIRGWADSGSVDSGRAFASSQADELKSHTHTGTATSAGSHDHLIATNSGGSFSSGSDFSTARISGTAGTSRQPIEADGAHTHTLSINSTGGSETRPRNKALLYCIKF